MTAPIFLPGPLYRHDIPERMWCNECERWIEGRTRAALELLVREHTAETGHEPCAF